VVANNKPFTFLESQRRVIILGIAISAKDISIIPITRSTDATAENTMLTI
jgi:hypothetical protein